MIWASIIALGLLWVLGIGSSYASGGTLYLVLIAVGVLMAGYRFFQNRGSGA